jgi:group II intron reverse transcriptase/maturase
VDGVTVCEYEENLAENLESLLGRLIGKRYRAQPVRRRYIAKDNGKQRPLGIPALEDKIVQMSASRILERIYEADFSDRSVGYRKGKPGARECSYQLGRELNGGTYRWIVEADIKSFFDEVNHDWLIRMIEQRVDDQAFTGLIRKWLKAGIMEPGAENPWNPVRGTPQGGIISPVLANIYLHYVLDLWIEKRLRQRNRGAILFMRYADDIIVGFEYQRESEAYLRQLPGRLAKFSLRLSEEKSSLVKFNRWEPDNSGKFTFLGFDFYWSRVRKNRDHKIVKRKTSKKKYRAALRAMKDWIRKSRSKPLREILLSLRKRLTGYWNYYCVIGNSRMAWKYFREVTRIVFKWLNRRSQRKSYTWAKFGPLWHGEWDIPRPRTRERKPESAQATLV